MSKLSSLPLPTEKDLILSRIARPRAARKGEARALRARGSALFTTHPTQNAGVPPLNKMGETEGAVTWEPLTETVDLVLSDSGKVKPVVVRSRAPGQAAVVDWVNFTVSDVTWLTTSERTLVTDDEHIDEASRVLKDIFGFGITRHHGKRLNFYQDSWVLGEDVGFVCYGGQNNTMLVMLTGQGCLIAARGWERRLHHFLTHVAVQPKLTRIDLAHDCFAGDYLTVDWADAQWEVRGYSCSFGKLPNIEHKGNWRRPSGSGRTLTIGKRESGKYLRVYEKGRKEGAKESPWTRAEIEFKSADRLLPFDMLIEPGAYFVGAYPCFAIFENHKAPESIAIRKKTGELTIEDSLDNTKTQFGKHISVQRQLFHELGFSDTDLLDRIVCADPDAWPTRLRRISQTVESCPPSIHEIVRAPSFDPDYIPGFA